MGDSVRPFGFLDVGCRHYWTNLGNFAIQREPRLRDLIVRLALSLVWLRLDDHIVQLTLSMAWLRHDQRCYESVEGQKDKHWSRNGYRKHIFVMSMAIVDASCYCFLPLPIA